MLVKIVIKRHTSSAFLPFEVQDLLIVRCGKAHIRDMYCVPTIHPE
jgi:hypothetical protein